MSAKLTPRRDPRDGLDSNCTARDRRTRAARVCPSNRRRHDKHAIAQRGNMHRARADGHCTYHTHVRLPNRRVAFPNAVPDDWKKRRVNGNAGETRRTRKGWRRRSAVGPRCERARSSRATERERQREDEDVPARQTATASTRISRATVTTRSSVGRSRTERRGGRKGADDDLSRFEPSYIPSRGRPCRATRTA